MTAEVTPVSWRNMNTFWIICLLMFYENGTSGNEIKLGELVEHKTTWEQDGVILLLYHIQSDATLFKIRAGFRNTNLIWLQSWTQKEFSGITMNFTLENQWKYATNTIGDQTVHLPEGQMKIGAGQHIGVYFPAMEPMALRLKAVNPKYPLFGSSYIPQNRELSLGENVKFGRIAYLNKLSIEFYLRIDETNTPTINSTTTIKTTKTISTATESTTHESKQSVSSVLMTSSTFEEVTSLRSDTSSGTPIIVTPLAERETKKMVIISVCATSGVMLLIFIIVGSVLFYRNKVISRPTNQFTHTSNPAYGVVLENRANTGLAKEKKELKGQTITKTENVYDTINSRQVYFELDESKMNH